MNIFVQYQFYSNWLIDFFSNINAKLKAVLQVPEFLG